MEIGRELDKNPKPSSLSAAAHGGESLETGGVKREWRIDLPFPSCDPAHAPSAKEAFLAGVPAELVKAMMPGDRAVTRGGNTYLIIPAESWPTLPRVDTDPERHLYRPVLMADWTGNEYNSYPPRGRAEWWDAAKSFVKERGLQGESAFARVLATIPHQETPCEVPSADVAEFLKVAQELPGWLKDGQPAVAVDYGAISQEEKDRLMDYRALVLQGLKADGYGRISTDGTLEYVDCSRALLAACHPVNLKKACEVLHQLGYQYGATPYSVNHQPGIVQCSEGRIAFDQVAGVATYRGKDGEVKAQVDLVESPWARLLVAPNAWKERAAAVVMANLLSQAEGADPVDFEESSLDQDPRQAYRITSAWVGEAEVELGFAKLMYILRVESNEGWSYTSCGMKGASRHPDMSPEALQQAVVGHLASVESMMCAEDDLLLFGFDGHEELFQMAVPAVGDEWDVRENKLSYTVCEELKAQWNVEVEE